MSKDDGDYLGYGVYADTLWARIARALNKDAAGGTLGDDPLVVGIFGEWGSGKSKLLSMVMQRAQAQSERDIAERVLTATSGNPMTVTVPVFFQPWKYEHERHLHVPLAVHIADALRETWKQMPADIEKMKVWLERTGKSVEETAKTIEEAKEKIEKAKGFFDGVLDAVKSRAGAVVAGTTDIMLTSVGVPPLASVARKSIIGAMGVESADDDDAEPDEAGEGKGSKKAPQGKAPGKSHKAPVKPDDPWAWKDDGLGFYRMQRQLQALTRPKLKKELLDKAGINITSGIEFDLRINFVIFIDDLDRCLPEKAVEALELIKTVFNLESFAFVLALDEEVIERGIGHRYVAYNLAGKKPEMPITGFEYLEKIVHLPFRLPALTRGQAAQFLRDYEERVAQPEPTLRWFAPPAEITLSADGHGPLPQVAGGIERRIGSPRPAVDLIGLTLNAFDIYVPRKLVRLVELMHTVAAVARERGQQLTWQTAAKVDVRVVLALLMIQLFQPEMYRLMRRRLSAFPALLSAFSRAAATGAAGGGSPGNAAPLQWATLTSHDVSDVDLWAWVGHGSTLPASTEADATATPREVHDPIARIQKIADPSVRSLAQQVRLPMVTQIVEYRGAQRHGFDLLKLMQALAQSLQASGGALAALDFQPYASLLGQAYEATTSAQAISTVAGVAGTLASGGTDPRARFAPRDLGGLFYDWQSPEPSVQANLAGQRELPPGQVLDAEAARGLLEMARDALAKVGGGEHRRLRGRLAQGLLYLAPFIARPDGPAFWAELGGATQAGDDLGQPLADLLALVHRERWMDLRSTLGADPRWDAKRFYLPAGRFSGHDEMVEPISGFVRVRGVALTIGEKGQSDSLRRQVTVPSDFFMARHLTTVDQFAAFIAAKGYEKDDFWDSQGIAWREGAWAARVNDKDLRKWLDGRTVEQRQQPILWAKQRAHGSRPVWGVNWFEARAYARWLNAQLAEDLAKAGLAAYEVCLPIEAQWERAAKAVTLNEFNNRIWPWGDDQLGAPLRANIVDSEIGRASVVGLFEPNPLGLTDLAGNLLELQDNLYEGKGIYKGRGRIPRIASQLSGGQKPPDWLLTELGWEESALPALRGGSWDSGVDSARVLFRGWSRSVDADDDIGFRLVLSLAQKGSET